MTELTIEGAPVIGEYAFARLSGLTTVRVNSMTPPKASVSSFYGIAPGSVSLVVPKGSEKAYMKAAGWSRFYAEPRLASEVSDPRQCLIPIPQELSVKKGAKTFNVHTAWHIVVTAADDNANALDNEKERAREMLSNRIGNIVNSRQRGVRLVLGIDPTLADDEAYTMVVDSKGVCIKGKTPRGVFWGLMTLDQVLRGSGNKECVDAIPQLTIKDTPRTHVRELMVDPARTFIPIDELKAFVPEMARYKLNALHLHLVDDQAWRIEIKNIPSSPSRLPCAGDRTTC